MKNKRRMKKRINRRRYYFGEEASDVPLDEQKKKGFFRRKYEKSKKWVKENPKKTIAAAILAPLAVAGAVVYGPALLAAAGVTSAATATGATGAAAITTATGAAGPIITAAGGITTATQAAGGAAAALQAANTLKTAGDVAGAATAAKEAVTLAQRAKQAGSFALEHSEQIKSAVGAVGGIKEKLSSPNNEVLPENTGEAIKEVQENIKNQSKEINKSTNSTIADAERLIKNLPPAAKIAAAAAFGKKRSKSKSSKLHVYLKDLEKLKRIKS
jgi:hypothetical protein